MGALSVSPTAWLASLAPLAVRTIVGTVMFAHGLKELTQMVISSQVRAVLARLHTRSRERRSGEADP